MLFISYTQSQESDLLFRWLDYEKDPTGVILDTFLSPYPPSVLFTYTSKMYF